MDNSTLQIYQRKELFDFLGDKELIDFVKSHPEIAKKFLTLQKLLLTSSIEEE